MVFHKHDIHLELQDFFWPFPLPEFYEFFFFFLGGGLKDTGELGHCQGMAADGFLLCIRGDEAEALVLKDNAVRVAGRQYTYQVLDTELCIRSETTSTNEKEQLPRREQGLRARQVELDHIQASIDQLEGEIASQLETAREGDVPNPQILESLVGALANQARRYRERLEAPLEPYPVTRTVKERLYRLGHGKLVHLVELSCFVMWQRAELAEVGVALESQRCFCEDEGCPRSFMLPDFAVEHHDDFVGTLAVGRDAVFAVTGGDWFRVFSLRGQEVLRFPLEGGRCKRVCASSSLCYVVAEREIFVLDTRVWVERRPFIDTNGINALSYCPSSNLLFGVACARRSDIYLLDADTLETMHMVRLDYEAANAAMNSRSIFIVNETAWTIMVYDRAALMNVTKVNVAKAARDVATATMLLLKNDKIRIPPGYSAAVACSETHLFVQERASSGDRVTVYSLDTWTELS